MPTAVRVFLREDPTKSVVRCVMLGTGQELGVKDVKDGSGGEDVL